MRKIAFLLFLLLPGVCAALGPHEIMVLVNESSADSVQIAKEYVKLRSVPESNVLRLKLPGYANDDTLSISPADFTALIWTPTLRAIRERGLGDHILAWIYSADFPTTVSTKPAMSVQGLTFVANQVPTSEEIDKALYASPLFCGPEPGDGRVYASETFDTYAEWLGSEMPIPSMMLGYTGRGGSTVDTVIQRLREAAGADGLAPVTGTVYFVIGDDIRSKCRQWQYVPAYRELIGRVNVVFTRDFPQKATGVLGVMMGQADVNPEHIGSFLPGSMADHLTSAAGNFASSSQTKLTAWINAGATASAGTVTEPFSAWQKFPSARFYVHYVNGCTMIESFYQSIRSPLQILLVGDPLVSPFARINAQISVSTEEISKSESRLTAAVKTYPGNGFNKFMYLLDGRIVGRGRELVLKDSDMTPGEHMLRVVAYGVGPARSQIFAQARVTSSTNEAAGAEKK